MLVLDCGARFLSSASSPSYGHWSPERRVYGEDAHIDRGGSHFFFYGLRRAYIFETNTSNGSLTCGCRSHSTGRVSTDNEFTGDGEECDFLYATAAKGAPVENSISSDDVSTEWARTKNEGTIVSFANRHVFPIDRPPTAFDSISHLPFESAF
jgi:hypothetical protein